MKSNLVTKEQGKLYNKLFSLRQDADYKDFTDINQVEIAPLMSSVEEFLKIVDNLLY